MIGEKIIKIMGEIQPIEKTELDEEKNYKTPKSDEVIAMVNPLLVKHKVIILPIKVTNFVPQGNKIFLTMKYQFIDIEDPQRDCIEVEIPGGGFDEKGRAVYAALTGAYRYAMQETFAIPIKEEVKNSNPTETTNDTDTGKKIAENNNIVEQVNNVNEQDKEPEISEMSIEDIDALFYCEKVS